MWQFGALCKVSDLKGIFIFICICICVDITPISFAMVKHHTPLMEEQEAGKRDKNLASVEWTSELITLLAWGTLSSRVRKEEDGVKGMD